MLYIYRSTGLALVIHFSELGRAKKKMLRS